MCGIFGVINFDGKPADKEKVLSASDTIAHRGPDDSGIYYSTCHPESFDKLRTSSVEGQSANQSVALSHRRLSIIDLSPAAHQPMVSDDGRYVIVFNGEIYNYIQLRQEVRSKKLEVRSQSDTEVILKLYASSGPECLNYLRGMFAFAIWDDKEKKLFAARDRFGIKPFYYLQNDNEFIFASELKAIKHYKKGLTLSMQGIDAFLRTGSVPAPLTIYEETKALLPGHWMECKMEDGKWKMEIKKYWTFFDLLSSRHTSIGLSMISGNLESKMDSRYRGNDPSTHSINSGQAGLRVNRKYDEEAKKEIRNSLLDTIKAHMVSDVEVGAFLSGGIDSTAIVSLMRQAGHDKIKTISVTFPGHPLDESKYSNIAAKKYETNHFEYRLQEHEIIDELDKIINGMDQPTIDGINTYFVSKAAASFGLKVVLSGLGGDELFGGYSSFINIPKYQRIKSMPIAKPLMKTVAALLSGRLPSKAIEYFKSPDAPNAEYKLIRGLFTDSELRELGWRSDSRRTSFAGMTDSRQAGMMDSGSGSGMTNSASYWRNPESDTWNQDSGIQQLTPLQYISMLETCYYMQNQLLRDSDVFSMSNSLELRVPFVDHLLYGTVLPYLDSSFDRNFQKKMLVDTVGNLPGEIVYRPKQGFTFPFGDWMKHGKIKEVIIDLTNTGNSLFNKSVMTNLLNNFETGKIHWSRVWAMFVLSRFGS